MKSIISPKIIIPVKVPTTIPVSVQFLLFSLLALMFDAEAKMLVRIIEINWNEYVIEKIFE